MLQNKLYIQTCQYIKSQKETERTSTVEVINFSEVPKEMQMLIKPSS
jgi:hypothetical protein